MPSKVKKRELKTTPSDELVELIGWAKLIPIDFDFYSEKNFLKLKANLPSQLQGKISDKEDHYNFEVERYKTFAETVTSLRECAKYLMSRVPIADGTASELRLFLAIVPDAKGTKPIKEKADRIIDFREREHELFNPSNSRFGRKSGWHKTLTAPLFVVTPKVTEDFEFDYQSTYLMTVLKGIDARRLRLCEHCEHVFWAYQLNQRFCEDRCQKRAKSSRLYRRGKEMKKKEQK